MWVPGMKASSFRSFGRRTGSLGPHGHFSSFLSPRPGVIAWESADNPAVRVRIVVLFAINGVLNLLWSPLFFKLQRPDWAIYELLLFWLSIVVLIVAVAQVSAFAAWLLVPYLAWVTFAGWLNWRVVQLNKPFGIKTATGASQTVGSNGRVSS